MTSPFKQRLASGASLLGTFVKTPHPHVAEVLVRPASSAAHDILNALDCGADGVLVPHVRSAKEAAAVAASVHYGPGGGSAHRGYAGSSRAAG
jgi:2-keto-3-deoxy-L-rhamnonate aldolase RhmA